MRLHAEQDYWLQTHLFRIFNKVFILPFRRSEWIHHPFSPLCLLTHTQMLLSTCFAQTAHPSSLGKGLQPAQGAELRCSTQRLPQFPPSSPPVILLQVMFQGVRALLVTTAWAKCQSPKLPLCLMPGINAWKATWYWRWHNSSQTLPELQENSALPSPRAWSCQGVANLLYWP